MILIHKQNFLLFLILEVTYGKKQNVAVIFNEKYGRFEGPLHTLFDQFEVVGTL